MTATITELERQLDVIEHLEFDITCDLGYIDKPCSNPARWAMRRSCCGTIVLSCSPCKDERIHSNALFSCGTCGVQHISGRKAYVSIEPLRKS